jgi:hypothetical protein
MTRSMKQPMRTDNYIKKRKAMGMTRAIVGHTPLTSSSEAGQALGRQISDKLGGEAPDVLILFASPEHSFETLLQSLQQACSPKLMVGCSSAGEFSGCMSASASASVMAIRSDDILFNAALGRGLRAGTDQAIAQLSPVFTATLHPDYPYRTALVLTDALAGYADDLIHGITVVTGGSYQLFGGGAADDAKFSKTYVFHGTEAVADAAVVLEMLSKKPLGLGVRHGWQATGQPMRVTEADGPRLVSLNSMPAVEAFEQAAAAQGQVFNRDDPLPFFLHNVIGIDTGAGYKLRVPLTLNADGSISCAADMPVGATVRIMSSSGASAAEAARQAARAALAGLRGGALAGSLVFDCAATRLRLGASFDDELKAVSDALGSDNYAGCNTYGQIARADGQFNGFHNCTAIVCAIPQ